MLAYPKTKATRRQSNYSGQPSTTWGTSLTSDGTAHVEPATETELIATTDFDTHWVNIMFHTNSASAALSDSLVNIKVGSAGNEITVIENLLAGWKDSLQNGNFNFGFPLRIPAGSRISATHRSVRVSTAVRCMIELIGGGAAPHWTGTKVESVGALTASSRGTQVTPGGASEGTFTNLATNVGEFGYVLPMLCGNADVSETGVVYAVDIGAAGVLLPGLENFLFSGNTVEVFSVKNPMGRFCYIPAGTDIEARVQSSSSVEAKSVVLYGVV